MIRARLNRPRKVSLRALGFFDGEDGLEAVEAAYVALLLVRFVHASAGREAAEVRDARRRVADEDVAGHENLDGPLHDALVFLAAVLPDQVPEGLTRLAVFGPGRHLHDDFARKVGINWSSLGCRACGRLRRPLSDVS